MFTSLLLLSFLIANPVFALTQADVDFLIKAGFIAPDKVNIAQSAVSSSNTKTTTNTTTPRHDYNPQKTSSQQGSCLKLSVDLFNGMSGTSISALQKFLKSQNHFSLEPTGFFGSVTQSSVEAFQKAQGIVLNGTPETTGFGVVGPATRSAIEKISCNTANATASGVNDFFGYNLDDLFNYDADTNFSQSFNYDPTFNYESDAKYDADINYDIDDYDADIDYDVDLDYEADLSTSGGKDASVLLFVKAVNGQYLRGGNKLPVAVSSKAVELKWTSKNAQTCALNGDFQEKRQDVPVNGTANLTLVNPSQVASNGDPMYSFKIYCYATSSGYVFPGDDTALIWVANSSALVQ